MSTGGSSYVDATAGAVEHCEQMAHDNPDLADVYQSIAASCQQKLWHQLTLSVLDFVNDNPKNVAARTTAAGMHSYLALYNQVVVSVDIDSKLNPLRLARIASAVATRIAPHDMGAAKAVLENLLEKNKEVAAATAANAVNSSSSAAGGAGAAIDAASTLNATIFVQSKLSLLTLQQHADAAVDAAVDGSSMSMILSEEDKKQQLANIKTVITANAAKLSEFSVVSPDSVDQAAVHAAHYEQAMTYYKIVGPPEAFYQEAMSFLNYAPPPAVVGAAGAGAGAGAGASTASAPTPTPATATTNSSTTNYQQLAIDLCLAALTGDGVYNLGQVEQTPVLALLKDTDSHWLGELLHTVAAGDVTKFERLCITYATPMQSQPALVHRRTAVQEKLTLLALVHLVFEKDSTERTIAFAEMSERLQVSIDQVEWVVMRAFSVHLLEGSMDQVEQTVQITWVLPRVLNDTQTTDLAGRFSEWSNKVRTTKDFMQEQTVSTFG